MDGKGRERLSASTPIVVFAHLPLWTVYQELGLGHRGRPRALGYLKRFGSVTVLNGHIHQIQQKVEGNVSFHTARSTAFPQTIAENRLTLGRSEVWPCIGSASACDDQLRRRMSQSPLSDIA